MNKETKHDLLMALLFVFAICIAVSYMVLIVDVVTRKDYQDASINSVTFVAGPGIECDKEISIEIEHTIITCRLSAGD